MSHAWRTKDGLWKLEISDGIVVDASPVIDLVVSIINDKYENQCPCNSDPYLDEPFANCYSGEYATADVGEVVKLLKGEQK